MIIALFHGAGPHHDAVDLQAAVGRQHVLAADDGGLIAGIEQGVLGHQERPGSVECGMRNAELCAEHSGRSPKRSFLPNGTGAFRIPNSAFPHWSLGLYSILDHQDSAENSMTAAQQDGQNQPADDGRPANTLPKPWYRRDYYVHPSTWVITLLAAALWTLVIVAPERRVLPDRVEHGWPLEFATRRKPSSGLRHLGLARHAQTDKPVRVRLEPELWAWPGNGNVHPGLLLADLAIALAGSIVLALLLERRRRRVRSFWQLSLREVAALVLLAAIPCGWWGSMYRQTQRQAATLQGLERALAGAVFGDGISSTVWQSGHDVLWQTKGDWFLELFWDEETKPRWFAEAVKLTVRVEQDVADEAVALIGQLPSLQELSLEVYGGSRRISDQSVQAIAGLRRLRALTINRMGGNWDMSVIGLNDAQVAELARLTELRSLDLSNNHITDEGLRRLRGLKRLETLEVSQNPVTSAGLDDLTQRIPGLMVLDD